jgi:two-component system LytT family response regulator
MNQSENSALLRTIIVDDEPLARKGLRLRLQGLDDIEVIAECKNGREALTAVSESEPDLMFLDIQMPGLSGFDVISQMQQDNMPLVVFVTAFDQYAVDAFKVHAVDYLLKPIDEDRLAAAVERVRAHLKDRSAVTDKQRLLELVISITGKSESVIDELIQQGGSEGTTRFPEKIAIKDGSETTLVPVEEIDWVDAAGDYMCVHANNVTHIMRVTMKELEAQLDPTIFQRIHRSTIVNLDRVTKVCSHMNGEFHLILSCDATLKMSRSYKEKVKHFF